MVSISILAGLVAAALVGAQTIETSSASSVAVSTTISQSMPAMATAAFDPAQVNSSITFQWCLAQLNACPQICGGAASTNMCDQTALTYNCVCPNGTSPDVTSFANTLPFFICQQTFIQCVAAHPNDAQGQATCTNNEQCGTRNATAEALAQTGSAGGSSASATGTAASSSAGSATAAGTSAAATSSGAAIANIQQLSTGAFAAFLMACFKLFV